MLATIPLKSGRMRAARRHFRAVDLAGHLSRRVDERRNFFRRPFAVTAVLTLAVQMIVAASPAITACVDRPHTHGGVAVPDCQIHHQAPSTPAGTEHSHHDHASTMPSSDDGNPVIGCRCSTDVPLLFMGTVATFEAAFAGIPFIGASPLSPPRNTALASQDLSPPLPPPR